MKSREVNLEDIWCKRVNESTFALFLVRVHRVKPMRRALSGDSSPIKLMRPTRKRFPFFSSTFPECELRPREETPPT